MVLDSKMVQTVKKINKEKIKKQILEDYISDSGFWLLKIELDMKQLQNFAT
jgi:hypothetical protein